MPVTMIKKITRNPPPLDTPLLGVGSNTVTVEQIAYISGMNRANCDTDTNVGM